MQQILRTSRSMIESVIMLDSFSDDSHNKIWVATSYN